MKKESFLIVLIYFLFFYTSINIRAINAQQMDTVQINLQNPFSPLYKVVASTDTIKGKYFNRFIISISLFNLLDNKLFQQFKDTMETDYSFEGFSISDVNLDNFSDIILRFSHNDRGFLTNSFWLYDSSENSFLYSKSFSMLEEYSIDDYNNKIIRAYDSYNRGMFYASEYKYKINGSKLILIEDSNCLSLGSGNRRDQYYCYKKKLLNDKLQIVELDSLLHTNNMYVHKYYEFILDTLRLKEVLWAKDKEAKFTDSSNPSLFFQTIFGYTFKYHKKIVYDYFYDSQGNIQHKVQIFNEKNNKWVLAK